MLLHISIPNGSIKSKQFWTRLEGYNRFQFLMVQLKVKQFWTRLEGYNRFQFLMVQLKVKMIFDVNTEYKISIPNGSIKSIYELTTTILQPHFNS